MLDKLKRDGISIQADFTSDLPEVFCNRQQVQQVLLNIFSNARYALNKKYDDPDPNKKFTLAAVQTTQNQTPFVVLTITDYGIGIENDIMKRLFTPLFSTKPKGEGTGLGLSISHSLIQDNKGFLRIQSTFSEYAALVVGLPVHQSTGGTHGR